MLWRPAPTDVFRADDDGGEELLAGEGRAGIRAIFEQQGLSAEVVDAHAAVHEQPGALTAALNWYRATNPVTMRGVPSVEVATLFVWSTDDPAISREAAEGCVQHVKGSFRFEVLVGVGHWIPELEAESFDRLLLQHLLDH